MQKWYASGTVYAKRYRTMSEISAASKELRKAFPDQGAIRLRTAQRAVGLVYQVLFELDGKSKALQLEATSVLEAYEAAKVVLSEKATGKVTSGRVPPAGFLRRTEIACRQFILDEGLREESARVKVRALEQAVGWLTERGLGLTTNTLLDCIRATDRTKRERRSRITVCKLLAKEAGIPLEVPSGLTYLDPGAKRREIRSTDEKLLYRELGKLDNIPEWARYLFRVVACTGCRANAVFSMEIPRGPMPLAWLDHALRRFQAHQGSRCLLRCHIEPADRRRERMERVATMGGARGDRGPAAPWPLPDGRRTSCRQSAEQRGPAVAEEAISPR